MMQYLTLKEANEEYKKGNYSELVISSLDNYYKTRQDVWLDSLDNPLINIRLEWILNQIDGVNVDSALDVGSWTGLISNEIYKMGCTDIDSLELSTEACNLGKTTYPHLNFINESIYTYTTTKKYDLIIASEILEHLHNPNEIVDKLISFLKNSGTLLITIPSDKTLFKEGDYEHLGRLDLSKLNNAHIKELKSNDGWEWYAIKIINKEVVNDKWVFHLLGSPNYKTGWLYAPNNPFNTKLIYLAKMLKELGHTVIHYGVEGSDVPYVDKHVTVVSEKTFNKLYGNRDKNALDHLSEESGPAWDEFNNNTIRELEKRIKDPGKEFLINFLGYVYKPITNKFSEKLICVEPGIGHNGSYLVNRIFESYAWQNHVYGKECPPQQSFFPNIYDTVIPAYFDVNDYPFVKDKSDYYLYIGRITWGKGLSAAVELTKHLGAKLIVIGGGDVRETVSAETNLDHVTQLGVLGIKDKVKYLANAKALIYYSLYVEPFGHAPIEAMLCGTPVITSDLGAFSETNIHGLTGYRVSTLNELYWAAKSVDKLDPVKIRKYAVDNYGLDRIKLKFKEHFKKLHGLRTGTGWYSLDKNNPQSLEHLTKYL